MIMASSAIFFGPAGADQNFSPRSCLEASPEPSPYIIGGSDFDILRSGRIHLDSKLTSIPPLLVPDEAFDVDELFLIDTHELPVYKLQPRFHEELLAARDLIENRAKCHDALLRFLKLARANLQYGPLNWLKSFEHNDGHWGIHAFIRRTKDGSVRVEGEFVVGRGKLEISIPVIGPSTGTLEERSRYRLSIERSMVESLFFERESPLFSSSLWTKYVVYLEAQQLKNDLEHFNFAPDDLRARFSEAKRTWDAINSSVNLSKFEIFEKEKYAALAVEGSLSIKIGRNKG